MNRLFAPHVFQGPRNLQHEKGYFEGWYYKFVSETNRAYAIIPGISLKKDRSFAFIQTINGENGESTFTEFPIDEFKTTEQPFSVTIGKNYFSLNRVELIDRLPVKGRMEIINPRRYKITLTRPGIMGWFRYVPVMECYHGVVSTGHQLSGSLEWGSEKIDFHNGSGYIEKDWGTSFPSSYIWMQSNNFKEKNHSFMLSLARIPWFGSQFRGFLGFLDLGNRILTFSTYTGAKLRILSIDDTSVHITVEGHGLRWNNSLNKGESLHITATRGSVGQLLAPTSGTMDRRIGESIDAEIQVEYCRAGVVIYQGKTQNSGLEIVGDSGELL